MTELRPHSALSMPLPIATISYTMIWVTHNGGKFSYTGDNSNEYENRKPHSRRSPATGGDKPNVKISRIDARMASAVLLALARSSRRTTFMPRVLLVIPLGQARALRWLAHGFDCFGEKLSPCGLAGPGAGPSPRGRIKKPRPARGVRAGRGRWRSLYYRTLLIASQRGPMLVGVMPATLMRPEPTM